MSNPWDAQAAAGQGGYLPPLPQNTMQNPWEAMASGDGAAAVSGIQQGSQALASMGGQMQAYQTQSAPYPSFPNAAGLGSQGAFSQAPSPMPQSSGGPPSPGLPTGVAGTNPWVLSGGALSR